MASTITRSQWVDDDGSTTTGTILNNAALQGDVYDRIDALLARVAGVVFDGPLTCVGSVAVAAAARPAVALSTTGSLIKARVVAPVASQAVLSANLSYDGTNWNRDDVATAAASLLVGAGGNLIYSVTPAGANPAVMTPVLTVNQAGSTLASALTLGAALVVSDGTPGKARVQSVVNTASFLKNLRTDNAGASWVQDDPSQCGTMLHQSAAGGWYFYYSPPGGTIANVAMVGTNGYLTCAGVTASGPVTGGPNGSPSFRIGGATAAFPAWRNTGAVAECVLGDASAWATCRALNFNSVSNGNYFADLTISGALSVTGGVTTGQINCNGNFINTGYVYPGRADAPGNAQTSWILAGHGSYGLYINTGLYVVGQVWMSSFNNSGNGTMGVLGCTQVNSSGPVNCTNIVPSALIYGNGIGSAAASVSITLAADGYIRRISSSERFKEDIRRGWTNPQRAALLGISPILYTAKEDTKKQYGDYLGFSAEELDAAGLRLLVNYEADKTTPASIREHAFLASFLDVLKDHERRIVALEGDHRGRTATDHARGDDHE